MVNPALLTSLAEELKADKSSDEIIVKLTAQGFQQQEIMEALNQINSTPPLPSQPLQQQVYTNTPIGNTNSLSSYKWLFFILAPIALISIATSIYLFVSKTTKTASTNQEAASSIPTNVPTLLPTQTPYNSLTLAINKTIAAKSLTTTYTSVVKTNISSTKTGVTQTISDNADGTLTGLTDGSKSDLEIKLYTPSLPNVTVNMSQVTPGDGNVYVKNTKSSADWQKINMNQFMQNDNSPTDASLYGIDLLSSIYSSSQEIFKSFSSSEVTQQPDITVGSDTTSQYTVNVDNQMLINLFAQDKSIPARVSTDSKIILQNATIAVTYSVDKTTGYVSKLHIDSKGLSQIPTPQSQQLGVSTSQDITLDAIFSDYGKSLAIPIPSETKVLGASTSIFENSALPLQNLKK